MQSKKILYVADFQFGEGGTDLHRMQAIQKLGHQVVPLTVGTPFAVKMRSAFPVRAARKFFQIEFDWSFLPKLVENACRQDSFDLMWIDKGTYIPAKAIHVFRRFFPDAKIVGYSPDDMMNPSNHSQMFRQSLPLYDLFFTTKSYNVPELQELGCQNVHFIANAYSEKLHRPMPLSHEERAYYGGSVVFIGSWEEERSRSICYLGDHAIPVKIWGETNWSQLKNPPPSLQIGNKAFFGDEYAKVLSASDISLCFLRKVNRDLQTTRSLEIPACGSFMLAERTDEHLALFEEGKEAEFFSSNQELLQKVRYYTEHPEERKAIARAGYERCISGGYSNISRMKQMFSVIFQKENEPVI